MSETKRKDGAPAVRRALEVLQLVADEGGSMRMSDIATRLEMPKSSLHHVLAALIDAGWIERDESSKKVALGIRTWEVGQAYEIAKTLSQRAQPFIDVVRDKLGETVRVAVLSGLDNVCIGKAAGSSRLVLDQRVGARLPAHATGLGKALLVGLSDEQLTEMYAGYDFEPFTENTIVSLEQLKTDVAISRKRGWAEDNGEYILGIRCIALPVRNRLGEVVASLSVSVPATRFTPEHQNLIGKLLSEAADELSKRIAGEVTLT